MKAMKTPKVLFIMELKSLKKKRKTDELADQFCSLLNRAKSRKI